MDEIQRWLEACLAEDPSDAEREDVLQGLMETEESDQGMFLLYVGVGMSQTSSWWYDTMVEYARRSRQPNEREEYPKLQRIFTDWCVAVAAGDIKRPTQRGRPKKDMRDELICMAMERYRDRALDGEAVSDSEARGRVADAAGLDDSVVAKIWRRYRRRQKREPFLP